MKVIEKKNFPNERDLYGVKDVALVGCTFDGVEDGESALKEASNIALEGCYMNLRYPLWHDKTVVLDNVTMTENCRAAMWYSEDITIRRSRLRGIKALRECNRAAIDDCKIVSPEFGWKSAQISLKNCIVESEYIFLAGKDVFLDNVRFKGKYSFQYVENVTICDSELDTKDAFWHAKNVTVRNSVVKGEYLGWYSHNLTFVNCKIIGTQPLCYCGNLKLIDCTMEATDFSFEYSDVEADIKGKILSVKNPRSGYIAAEGIDEIIHTADSKYPFDAKIIVDGVTIDKPTAK